jgi:hypothetical protein
MSSDNRLDNLTLILNSSPNATMLNNISLKNGIYSPYDYVSKKQHVVWFDMLSVVDLITFLDSCTIHCGTETRYSVEDGKDE